LIAPKGGQAQNFDPLAANNGLYPSAKEWNGPFRLPNLLYPDRDVPSKWVPGAGIGFLNTDVAGAYANVVKTFLEPSLKAMINDPLNWDPKKNNWFNMVWSGQGSAGPDGKTDPNSGRESLLASYTGQVMPADTFEVPYQPTVDLQNHAVIYYNATAAAMLGRLWHNLYDPDTSAVKFPEGSIVVKGEAATTTPEQWPVVANSAIWNVYRPTVEAQECGAGTKTTGCSNIDMGPRVLELRALVLSIAIKDAIAAPHTGWVFLAFVYDTNAQGATPWDRFVPLGVQWGNDPELANSPSGRGPSGTAPLKETWVNRNAPGFVMDTLGWGGRLAGPVDVATRHNVVTPSGKRFQGANHLRASSCISCHGASEYPFTTNLYPSPNKSFPPDGQQFLLYDPGSPEWAEWFQNRSGQEPMSLNKSGGVQALDYDWVVQFALSAFNAASGKAIYVHDKFDVH